MICLTRFLIGFLMMTSATAQAAPDIYEAKVATSTKLTAPKATVVFLHGGAWQGGDKSDYRALGEMFASQGIRAVVANYRVSSEAPHPAPIDDLEKTLAALTAVEKGSAGVTLTSKGPGKTVAGTANERIFLIGHSAGAHMIAYWNTVHTSPNIRGFIGLEGIYDIPALIAKWPSYRDGFISKEFGTDSTKWASASPSLLPAKSKMPWLVIHSTKDELVDLAQSSEFSKHVGGTLVTLTKESHFGAVESLSNPTSEASKAILKFIAEQSR